MTSPVWSLGIGCRERAVGAAQGQVLGVWYSGLLPLLLLVPVDLGSGAGLQSQSWDEAVWGARLMRGQRQRCSFSSFQCLLHVGAPAGQEQALEGALAHHTTASCWHKHGGSPRTASAPHIRKWPCGEPGSAGDSSWGTQVLSSSAYSWPAKDTFGGGRIVRKQVLEGRNCILPLLSPAKLSTQYSWFP